MTNKGIFSAFITVLITCISVSANSKSPASDPGQPAKATPDLVSVANQYKASVEALITIYEREVASATEALKKRRELYAQGIISGREFEASEQAVKDAQARLDQARKQITQSNQLVAEAKAEAVTVKLKPAVLSRSAGRGGYSTTSAVMRYNGSSRWSLAQASQVRGFFASKFGRTLPVSAFGQSATHSRMGYDHRNAMDVALHPDSAEGEALMAYLRSNGIPFIAFRSAVRGSATGAHIHIGYPSRRMR